MYASSRNRGTRIAMAGLNGSKIVVSVGSGYSIIPINELESPVMSARI